MECFFIMMILSSQLVGMLIKNHVIICHITLQHSKKSKDAAQTFRYLNELFGEGIPAKTKLKGD